MSESLRIAVASGKGGTGKTTIATSLAVVLSETGVRMSVAAEGNGGSVSATTLREGLPPRSGFVQDLASWTLP